MSTSKPSKRGLFHKNKNPKSPDTPSIPSVDTDKDILTSMPKADAPALPSIDAGHDIPVSMPKIDAAPSTITTTDVSTTTKTVTTTVTNGDGQTKTITSTVTDAKDATATTTMHHTEIKTVTVPGSLTTNLSNMNATSATGTLDRALAKPSGMITLSPHNGTATCLHPPQSKQQISPAAIAAIVFGLLSLLLAVVMVFLVRRFYRMYRAERVMRKQAQTEGNELKKMHGDNLVGGTTVVDRPSKGLWGFSRRDSWEK